MGTRVRSGEADESSARVGVKMRSSLAHQVGSPQEAVGTDGNFGGLGGELIVGFAGAAGVCGKGVAEPAQGKAGGLRDAHDVPASGDGVAKRMDAARQDRKSTRLNSSHVAIS